MTAKLFALHASREKLSYCSTTLNMISVRPNFTCCQVSALVPRSSVKMLNNSSRHGVGMMQQNWMFSMEEKREFFILPPTLNRPVESRNGAKLPNDWLSERLPLLLRSEITSLYESTWEHLLIDWIASIPTSDNAITSSKWYSLALLHRVR